MTEKEHQYYRRRALCDPDLIVCPVCDGSGKVARPSGEDDLLVDEGTYPVSLGRLLILDSAVQGENPAKPVFVTRWYVGEIMVREILAFREEQEGRS